MNLFELQTRANALVAKVNAYEDTIEDMTLDENEIIDQHLYADIFCLRTVMHRLFATTPADRASTSLSTTDIDWSLVTQTAVGRNEIWKLNDNTYRTQGSEAQYVGDITTNNDMMSHYNMIVGEPAYPYAKYLLNSTSAQTKSKLVSGNCFNVYGAHISDALITESQTSNIFRWNTTPEDDITNVSANSNIPQQVPGIVTYYLGSGYDGEYSATIPYNTNKSSVAVNYNTPAIYGAFYKNIMGPEDVVSQQPKNRGAEGLRMFMPGTTFFNGGAISPIDIYQPFPRYDTPDGYNYQGKALYHELTFKRRRAGSSAANVDFLPFKQFEAGANDNDPQGLAMRLALAQQKPYYYNRPWFTELDELYTTEGTKQAALADKIIEDSKSITYDYDTSVYNKNGNVSINEETTEATNFSNSNYLTYTTPEITAEPITQFIIRGTFTIPARSTSSAAAPALSQVSAAGKRPINLTSNTSTGRVRVSMDGDTEVIISSNRLFNENDIVSVEVVLEETGFVMRTKTSTEGDWTVEKTVSRPDAKVTDTNTTFYIGKFADGGGNDFLEMIRLSDLYLEVNNKVWIETPSSEVTSNMTDSEFYNNYQLNYSTYAEALGEPQ